MFKALISAKGPTQGATTTVRAAAVDILPLSIAVIPWGILCGSLAIQTGLSPLQAQLMSLLVFAGAAQLGCLSLLGAGSLFSPILSSTLVISARHLLYSAVFQAHARDYSWLKRVALAFFLTDEMFAVTCAYLEKHQRFNYLYTLTVGIVFYLIWNIATYVGISAGKYIPNLDQLGLEFAIAATFIAIVIPSIKQLSTLLSVIGSGSMVLILDYYAVEYALMIATCFGMMVGFLSSERGDES